MAKFGKGEVRKAVTHVELILECLQLGLDGEKVDYEWEKSEERCAILKFEDGRRIRVAVEEMA